MHVLMGDSSILVACGAGQGVPVPWDTLRYCFRVLLGYEMGILLRTRQMHPPKAPICTHGSQCTHVYPRHFPGEARRCTHAGTSAGFVGKGAGVGTCACLPAKMFFAGVSMQPGEWGFSRVAKMMVMAVVHGFDGFCTLGVQRDFTHSRCTRAGASAGTRQTGAKGACKKAMVP